MHEVVVAAEGPRSEVSVPAFELDHMFVAVSPQAPQMSLLVSSGFEEGNRHPHPGQGTASTGVFFANAYVELLWLEDTDAAEAPAIRRTHLSERIDVGHEACPFGIGIRRSSNGETGLPFPTWDYRPPYLPAGASIPMALNSEVLEEPLLFVLPWKTGPGYECPVHPNGARAITKATLGMQGVPPYSTELSKFVALNLVDVVSDTDPLLQIELDDGRSAIELDLRPEVPLVLRW